MTGVLTDEWFAALVRRGGALPARPGATASFELVVAGAPGGEVTCHLRLEDGRVVTAGPGPSPDEHAFSLAVPYADLGRLAAGELRESVAFMRGRAKLTGTVAGLFALLPVLDSPEWREVVAPA